jgi:transmembrane sensor
MFFMKTPEREDNIVQALILDFLSGNSTMENTERLQCLLQDNPGLQTLFNEMKMAWDASGSYITDGMSVVMQQPWNKINAAISSEDDSKKRNSIFYSHLFRIVRVAALWLLFIAIGSFITWVVMKPSSKAVGNSLCTIQTPLGSRSHMVLPDGTQVWLNAGTTIRYPGTFSSKQRDIYLTGEAYFKVATNKKWPFVVHTPEINVKALGTAFNVKAYPGEKAVTTTLVEGVVKLESNVRKFTCTLKPKQELVFLKEQKHKENAVEEKKKEQSVISNQEQKVQTESANDAILRKVENMESAVSWKDSRWIIDGELVDNLAVMLERRYDIKVNILSNELKQFRFSGTIENETMEQVLKYLSYTIPLKYQLDKGVANLDIDNNLKEKYKTFLKTEARSAKRGEEAL